MSKFVSVVAGLLTFGAVAGYFNGKDENTKTFNLQFGLITAGLTVGSVGSSFLASKEQHHKTKSLSEKFDKEMKVLIKEKDELLSHNKEFTVIYNEKDKTISELNERLQRKEITVSALKQSNQVLELATKQKIAEIDAKLARDDDRQDLFIEEVKSRFAESLKIKIDYEYERIGDTTVFRLNDERFVEIHSVLNRFYQFLKENHHRHYELMTDIYSLEGTDIVDELTSIYFQISGEISSYHVRLRNILNLEERTTLEVFRDELIERRDPKKFVAREKVQQGLDYFQDKSKAGLEKVRQTADQNDIELQQIRENVTDLIDQIEARNLEINNLKEQIANLKSPMFWNLANSRELEIGNLIIKYFWKNGKGIYLDRSHIESDGYALTLYYQTDRNPRAIIEKELNEHSEPLQQFCRVIKPIEFSYSGAKGLMTAKVVLREKPKLETKEEDIYKYGLIPSHQFCDAVAKATDHKTKGKPTLRVMAATGEGKGIAVKNLLAYFAELEGWEIWLSDPVDGSEEDHWDTPKIATNSKDAGKAYSLFLKLFKERQELKQEGFTDRSVLAVFDEFDKQHDMDDKQAALEIMTAIRHSRQRQILIGQCAEVGKNGWAWDDMKNCSLLVLGASIGTLIKHLSKDFGWTKKKENQVKREYERFSSWADNQNINNPDIPDENQARISLLIAGDRYQFLEVPIAHKGILKNGKAIFRDTLTATPAQHTSVSDSTAQALLVDCSPTAQKCPKCGSTNLGSHGRLRHKCKDCGKTWKK